MRIDLNTPVPQNTATEKSEKSAVSTNQAAQSAAKADNAAGLQDTVSLSSLATQALNSPEVRHDKVDSLRQAVSSGQYQIDPKAIADAILGEKGK